MFRGTTILRAFDKPLVARELKVPSGQMICPDDLPHIITSTCHIPAFHPRALQAQLDSTRAGYSTKSKFAKSDPK
jgi:hypothetical protein